MALQALARLRRVQDASDEPEGAQSDRDSFDSMDEFARGQALQRLRNRRATMAADRATDTGVKDNDARKSVGKLQRRSPEKPSKADIISQEVLESVRNHFSSRTARDQQQMGSPTPESPVDRLRNRPKTPVPQARYGVEHEVAAIIIQTYWHQWCAWRLQVRQAAESKMLRLLGMEPMAGGSTIGASSGDFSSFPGANLVLDVNYIEEATKVLLGQGTTCSRHEPEAGTLAAPFTAPKSTQLTEARPNSTASAAAGSGPVTTRGNTAAHGNLQPEISGSMYRCEQESASASLANAMQACTQNQADTLLEQLQHLYTGEEDGAVLAAQAEQLNAESRTATSGDKSLRGQPGPQQPLLHERKSIRMSSDKLKSILDYLDDADHQAEADVSTTHGSNLPQRDNEPQHQPPTPAALQDPRRGAWDPNDNQDSVSACGSLESAPASLGNKSAVIAESIFQTFKTRAQKLQDEIKQRESVIAKLTTDMENLKEAHEADMGARQSQFAFALEQQRQENESAIARHLGFIDRLLADKDELSKSCSTLMEQVQALQLKQEKAITAMQEGWVAELKRHKESWAAAEKTKREQWMEAKTSEIKELTITGLEQEVQNILAKQRAEMLCMQEQCAEGTRKQLEAQSLQHEAAIRQLKERLLREQEDALDRERAGGQNRVREASERYEQQLQSQRLRMIADQDLRLDQLEAQHRDERRRLEEAAAQAAQASKIHEQKLMADAAREKEALRHAHQKELDEMRQQLDTQQQGWKDAVLERNRRELAQREAKLREDLRVEQQDELRVVLERLESDMEAERKSLEDTFIKKEQSLAAKHAAELRDARKSEARNAEKFRLAAETGRTAEDRAAAADQHLAEMRKEFEAKNERLRWFEEQLAKAEEKEARRVENVQAAATMKEDGYKEQLCEAGKQIKKLTGALEHAMKVNEDIKQRRARDMEYLDQRVKATLAKKEERIQELQSKLASIERDHTRTAAMLSRLHDDCQTT